MRNNEEENSSENEYVFVNFYGELDNTKYLPLCIMEYIESEKHYQLLYFNTNFKRNIIINDLNQNNINENIIQKEEVKNLSSSYVNAEEKNRKKFNKQINKENNTTHIDSVNIKSINSKEINNITFKNKIADISDDIKKMNNLIDKKQIDLLNINKDKTNDKKWHIGSDYPVYPLDSDEPENFYANIYNYLLKRNNNQNGENYPKYIYECKDNIETKKRAFRRKASNFEIDDDNMLCYRVPDSYNGNDSSEESDKLSNENKKNKIKEKRFN